MAKYRKKPVVIEAVRWRCYDPGIGNRAVPYGGSGPACSETEIHMRR